MDFCNSKLRIALFTSALLLTGCGGGGDDSGGTTPVTPVDPTPVTPVDPTNQSPTVSFTAPAKVVEQEAFTLSATADDIDGSIASYSWSHNASVELTSDNLSAANATFTSPDITEDITVDFTVTVTDDKGASASTTQEVVIKRKVSNVTITGIVTDEPIANAELEIVVGNESFATQADRSGRYSILLDIDESSRKKLVRVKAKGLDASNPGVEFVSQLSSVEKLLAQAGDDNTLDSNDNFGVNITNVTTAEFALLTRGGAEPSSEDELDAALLNVDADEKIQLATLIKIVVDNPDYQLPEGVNSTLELITDEQIAKKFEDEVNEKDPEIIEKTKKEIKQDDDLVTGPKTSLVGDYLINSPRYHNSRAYHLQLNEDGSGTFNSITQSELTWESVDGVIKLSFVDPVVNSEYTNTEENTSTTIFLDALSFEVLAENDVFRTLDVTETTSRKIVNTLTGEETLTPEVPYTYTSNLINKTKTLTLSEANLTGTWVLDTIGYGFDSDDPETIIFNNDGTGEVVTENNDPFTWSLSDTKLSVTYDDDGQTGVTNFWFTKALRGGYQLVSLDTSTDEAANSAAGLLIKKEPTSLIDEDFIGRWHGYIGTSQSFDMNVHADGTVMIGLANTNYQGEINDGQFSRKAFTYKGKPVTSCEGFDEGCYLNAQMRHEFLNVKDDYYYVLRTFEHFDPEGEITSSTASVLVYQYSKNLTYTEFTEELLGQWIELYKESGGTDYLYLENTGTEYTFEINGEQFTGLTFVDGVLSYEVDGITWYVELVSADTDAVIICHYQQGGECNEASQITYLPKRPKVTLTANSGGNGELSPMMQESFIYQNVGFEIIPADGYVVDSIEGCEGYIEGDHYIAFASNVDCEITANFKEADTFIIGNSDFYYASAYTVELSEDSTGSLTYNGKVDVTWIETTEGAIEITPLSDFVLQEYESYSNSTGMNVATKDIATKLTLTPLPEKGSNWFELAREIEQYQDDVLVDEYTSSYEVNKTNLDQRLAITTEDIVGDWSVDLVGEDTVYKVAFSDDGTGVSHNISDLSDESFTWQVSDNTMVLNFPEDGGTESLYITKDLNVGYQVVTQGIFDGEHYTDSGIMVRRNEQAITADNFAGRHQFRDGHGIDTHWSEMQVYDDGEIFFTFSTSAYQRGFEDGHLKRDLYTEYVDGRSQRVDWCDVTLDSCTLEGEFIYTLVAVDGQRYFIERTLGDGSFNEGTTAHLYIHDYSPSTEVDQFYEYDLDYIGLYQNDSNGIARWFVTYGDYDEAQDKQYYTFQLDDAEPVNVELVDGKLELILEGQDTVIELIDNDRRDVIFCKYLKGNSCLEEDKVYLSFDAPQHTITVTSDGNGELGWFGDVRTLEHGTSAWRSTSSITPNDGYILDTITGCDGYIEDDGYRIPYVKESCQIDVTFKEFIPLSTQANITDPALAMCVDNSGETDLQSVTELRCQWKNYGEINSLAGLESLPNLQVLELEYLNIGTHLDLTAFEQLTEFTVGNNSHSEEQRQIESVQFYDPSKIIRLDLGQQNISEIDLSLYTSLQYLRIQSNLLTQINLSAQTQLLELDLQGTELNELDLSANRLLNTFYLNSGNLTELNIGHLTELRDAFLWGQTGVTELDVTNLTKLTRLDIGNMGVASLNLTNLVNLLDLGIAYTSINNLDFSALQSLSSLNVEGVEQSLVPWSQVYHISSLTIGGANYTSFDFSPFTNLSRLRMSQSGISDLSSIANPELILSLDLFNNYQLEQLNLSEMTSLHWLQINSSPITTLDFSNNSNLTNVYIRQSALETISGVEGITEESVVLEFYNNPLTAKTLVYLDDLRDNQGYYNISYSVNYTVTVSVTGNGTASDSNFTLSDGESRGLYLYPDSGYEVASVTGCDGIWHSADYYEVGPISASCEINIEFVEAIPLAEKAGITDPVLAECVNNSGYTRLEHIKSLDCAWTVNGEITSLVGLDAFPNLEEFRVSELNLGGGDIDMSQYPALKVIGIHNSDVTSLLVDDPSVITELYLTSNQLINIDLSEYTNLMRLDLSHNVLTNIELSQNIELVHLYLSANQLTEVDTSNNPKLQFLSIDSNALTTVNLQENINLQELRLSYNPITTIDLSSVTELLNLELFAVPLESLDLSVNTKLTRLMVSSDNESLTLLDVGHLVDLVHLELTQMRRVQEINLSNLAKLEQLHLGGMGGLSSLDLSNLPALTHLDISFTGIQNLDFTQLINLNSINLDGVQAEELVDFSELYRVSELTFSEQLNDVDFSAYTNLTSLTFRNSNLTNLDSIPYPEKLVYLDLQNNPELISVNFSLMTGLQSLSLRQIPVEVLDFSNSPSLQYVYAVNNSINRVVGLDSETNKQGSYTFLTNPLSPETITYFESLRDNQNYNIDFDVVYRVRFYRTGLGSLPDSTLYLGVGETQGFGFVPRSTTEIGDVTASCEIRFISDSELRGKNYEVGPLTNDCEVDVEYIEVTP